ncbi:acyl carrier protein [Roseibium sp.]|uniref:acyl carrier protein n=1 Tax=Roseibium sp. TaxID=1936156 RepID=UPI003A97138E
MTSKIRELLAKHGGLPVAVDTLADSADLYEAGLTSFASVQLMLALEEEFDVEIPENLLTRKSFSSIAAIADTLSQITDDRQVA